MASSNERDASGGDPDACPLDGAWLDAEAAQQSRLAAMADADDPGLDAFMDAALADIFDLD